MCSFTCGGTTVLRAGANQHVNLRMAMSRGIHLLGAHVVLMQGHSGKILHLADVA